MICAIITGWRRLIGSPKLQIIFHKRATNYRSLLRKMTYKDKGSYESSPPCNARSVFIYLNICVYIYTLHICIYMSGCAYFVCAPLCAPFSHTRRMPREVTPSQNIHIQIHTYTFKQTRRRQKMGLQQNALSGFPNCTITPPPISKYCNTV